MDNYKKIATLLEANRMALIETKEGEYIIVSSIRMNSPILEDKIIRVSQPSYTVDGACATMWIDTATIYYINSLNIKSIKPYTRPLRIPKPWDKVEILETVKELPDYESVPKGVRHMVWWPFIVGSTNLYAARVFGKWHKWLSYGFPLEVLAPRVWEEDEEIANAIRVLEKAGKIKDGKIIV